jgi:UDPglucose 6-dehydrogenase
MKIAVIGLWHLGCVTAACLARAGYEVIGYDSNAELVQQLVNGQPPIYEPGLQTLLQNVQETHRLSYTNDLVKIASHDIVWVAIDTPVDSDDLADVSYVESEIQTTFEFLKADSLFIVSSQLPVGTIDKLALLYQASYPDKPVTFVCIPENLRLGKAIEIFSKPDRVVVGLNNFKKQSQIQHLLAPFTHNIIWMSVLSAAMTKHAINAFLATSVTFVNELAALCEAVGANAKDVEAGMKSEERIGPKAYVRAGNAIAGGTLMRDVHYLEQLGNVHQRKTVLLSSLLASNQYHKQWSCRKLVDVFQTLKGKRIAMLGLAYKVGTDTLRRSAAIELCEWLNYEGAIVQAFDPYISTLPAALAQFIQLQSTAKAALNNADAVIVCTEHSQFQELTLEDFSTNALVLDASGFIANIVKQSPTLRYLSVGVPA